METLPPPRPSFPLHAGFSYTPPDYSGVTPKLAQWHTSYSFRLNGPRRDTQARSSEALERLGQALSEVDGWMAGTEFLDSRDRQKAQQSSVHSWDMPTSSPNSPYPQSLDSFFEDNCPTATPPSNSPVFTPSSSPSVSGESAASQEDQALPTRPDGCTKDQWAALQVVRDALNLHYRNLEQLCKEASPYQEAITELLDVYACPEILRKAGFMTLRNVLTDAIPTELPEIFAFAAVSYTLGILLHKRGCIHESRVLGGLAEWRDSIADDSGRKAFDFIARKLWPEANSRLDVSPYPPTFYANPQHTDTHDPQYELYGHGGTSMGIDPWQLPSNTAFFQGCSGAQSGWQMDSLFLVNASHQDLHQCNFLNEGLLSGQTPSIPPGHVPPDFPCDDEAFPTLADSYTPGQFALRPTPQRDQPPILASSLRDTDMVKVIFWCHQYLAGLCGLLQKLSGNGISIDRRQTVRGQISTDIKIARFHEQMGINLFAPLAKNFPSGVESMLLDTTRALVLDWSLRSLREAQEYLLTLCKALLPCDTSNEKRRMRKFFNAILNQCLAASKGLSHFVYPAHAPLNSDIMTSKYCRDYVDRRLRSLLEDLGAAAPPKPGRKRKRTTDHLEGRDGQVLVCRGRPAKTFPSGKPGEFVCPSCEYPFASYTNLRRHLDPNGDFACNFLGCTSRFNRIDNLKTHYKTIHGQIWTACN